MQEVHFDPTVTLGTILQTLAFVIACFSFYVAWNNLLRDMKFKIDLLWNQYAKEHNIIIIPKDK